MAKTKDSFPARLRSLRESRGLTVYALAKLAGADRHSLMLVERGEQTPSLETIQRVAKALEVSAGELVG